MVFFWLVVLEQKLVFVCCCLGLVLCSRCMWWVAVLEVMRVVVLGFWHFYSCVWPLAFCIWNFRLAPGMLFVTMV